MQVACALISTFAGCGDGLYTPGVGRDASAKRDAATDTESGAFVTRVDALSDTGSADAASTATKVKVGGDSVVEVARGGVKLTFEPQSFSPAAEVTIREMSSAELNELGARGHYKPVFELTFAGGMPKHAPVLKIDLSDIVDELGSPVVGLGKSLVLARFQPAMDVKPEQWLIIPEATFTDDGFDATLEKKAFAFEPYKPNTMVVGVLLNCYPAQDVCTGSCGQMCGVRRLNCIKGGLCQ